MMLIVFNTMVGVGVLIAMSTFIISCNILYAGEKIAKAVRESKK